MITTIRELSEPAPADLAARVLADVGIGDYYTVVSGPIGPLMVAWGHDGITAVEREGDEMGFELSYSLQFGRTLTKVDRMPERLAHQVERRLAGEHVDGPPVDLSHLTEFERSVLRKTMEIPRGEVRPYAWVAREIGRPRAVRAVGSALANNPIPFVIPCHRVVRTDGHIGEYGAGGPEAKREVLAVEGVDAGGARTARVGRDPLLRVGHDEDLLLPVVPARSTGHAAAPDEVPLGGRLRTRSGIAPARSAGRWRVRCSPHSGCWLLGRVAADIRVAGWTSFRVCRSLRRLAA